MYLIDLAAKLKMQPRGWAISDSMSNLLITMFLFERGSGERVGASSNSETLCLDGAGCKSSSPEQSPCGGGRGSEWRGKTLMPGNSRSHSLLIFTLCSCPMRPQCREKCTHMSLDWEFTGHFLKRTML